MSGSDTRVAARNPVGRVEIVTVYRDRRHLPATGLLQHLEQRAEVYTIFNVVGVVRDVSQNGLGISFEGQRLMGSNILRDGEQYVLKLTMLLSEVPPELRQFVSSEGSYSFVALRAQCAWHQTTSEVSRAGFELLDSNPPEVLAFVREQTA
ncbi:MAG: hypothetical protein IPL40_07720 [Proteobacteria bacterium]|nr:hypothetical protein [Pseudomonadota bacterium]